MYLKWMVTWPSQVFCLFSPFLFCNSDFVIEVWHHFCHSLLSLWTWNVLTCRSRTSGLIPGTVSSSGSVPDTMLSSVTKLQYISPIYLSDDIYLLIFPIMVQRVFSLSLDCENNCPQLKLTKKFSEISPTWKDWNLI